MKVLLIALLALLCLYSKGIAQPQTENVIPLTVGDTMPAITITGIDNYPRTSSTIKGFKKKLIILDFWATWCSSCVGTFPKMHQLQQEFDNQLQVIMVNIAATDTPDKVAALFKKIKARTGLDFSLPYVLQDELLHQYFPFETVPHYIWLDSTGKVLAITGQNEVNAKNVADILNGDVKHIAIKTDSIRDQLRTTDVDVLADALGTKVLRKSVIVDSVAGIYGANGKRFTPDGLVTRMYMINTQLLGLYVLGFPDIMRLPPNRIIIEHSVVDSFYSNGDKRSPRKYGYALTTSPVASERLPCIIRNDLEQYFNITAHRIDSIIPCYVLTSIGSHTKLVCKGGATAIDLDKTSLRKYISNGTTADLIDALGYALDKPFFDESGITVPICIEFPTDYYAYDLAAMNKFLKTYGLAVKGESRKISIALLSPIKTD